MSEIPKYEVGDRVALTVPFQKRMLIACSDNPAELAAIKANVLTLKAIKPQYSGVVVVEFEEIRLALNLISLAKKL